MKTCARNHAKRGLVEILGEIGRHSNADDHRQIH